MSQKGGAWKVAYADFITAMMALFMVLWILGAEQDLLDQIQQYFRNPPSPFERESGKFVVDMGEFLGRSSDDFDEQFFNRLDPGLLRTILREFYRVLDIQTTRETPLPVEITLTDDGLRVVIFDRSDTPLFQPATGELTPWGNFLIENLAWLLSRYRFHVVIDSHAHPAELEGSGHSDDSLVIDSWDLSTERALEIRRKLDFYSRGDVLIRRVSGFGDSRPLSNPGPGRTHQRIALSLSLQEDPDLDWEESPTPEMP